MKKNKRIIIILSIIFILLLASAFVFFLKYKEDKRKEEERLALIQDITNHYHRYVITNKETNLYDKEGNIIGKINKDINLTLKEIDNISENTLYFPFEELNDNYVLYKDLSESEEKEYDQRYKKYIPFNENIIPKDGIVLYDNDDNYLYTVNSTYSMPIYIREDNSYGVEFNNRLVYIKKEDVKEIIQNINTDKNNSNGVGVLNYHFFYDENDPDDKGCNEIICASKKQFKSHLDYFKENDILTIKMHELELYMDGKIRLPKSVLITIDDGARTKVAVNTLTEYQMYATIFLVTYWYNPKDYYVTDYVELHSHTHNMHDRCADTQSKIKCLSDDEVLTDLKKSREALGGSTAFCYPYYEYNNNTERLVKEAGFTMAFVGTRYASYGYKLAEPFSDKMKISRFVITTSTSMNEFKRYFNEIA